jgi:hypothetical protein
VNYVVAYVKVDVIHAEVKTGVISVITVVEDEKRVA